MGVIMMGMLLLGGAAKVSSKELCGWDFSKTHSSALRVLPATNLFRLIFPTAWNWAETPSKSEANFCPSSHHLVSFHRSWPCSNTPWWCQKLCCCLSDLGMRRRESTFPMDGRRGTSAHTWQTCLCCIFCAENESKPKSRGSAVTFPTWPAQDRVKHSVVTQGWRWLSFLENIMVWISSALCTEEDAAPF